MPRPSKAEQERIELPRAFTSSGFKPGAVTYRLAAPGRKQRELNPQGLSPRPASNGVPSPRRLVLPWRKDGDSNPGAPKDLRLSKPLQSPLCHPSVEPSSGIEPDSHRYQRCMCASITMTAWRLCPGSNREPNLRRVRCNPLPETASDLPGIRTQNFTSVG